MDQSVRLVTVHECRVRVCVELPVLVPPVLTPSFPCLAWRLPGVDLNRREWIPVQVLQPRPVYTSDVEVVEFVPVPWRFVSVDNHSVPAIHVGVGSRTTPVLFPRSAGVGRLFGQ